MRSRISAAGFRLLVVLTSLVLASGCTKVGTSASGSTGNPWTKHGVLRMANLSEPDTLNPYVGNFQIDTDLSMFWAGYFFNWNDRNEFVPELATEVPTLQNHQITPDGKAMTYHLRPGVLWQDGQPLTADDVIFSWHAVMNPKNNVSSRVGYDQITAIDKKDDHTVVVHLKQVYAPFVATFFTQAGNALPVLPAHLLAHLPDINQIAFNSQPIGTGPFIVDKWQRGQHIIFRANPHYWRGPPKLKEIDYMPIPDENTIVTLLRTHEADFEYNASANLYAQDKDIPGTRVDLVPFTQYSEIAMNLRTPALSDVRVRQALWYGTDIKTLIHDITHDVNVPGYTDQPSFLWAYNPHVQHYDYNPAKAASLLDAAGWKMGPSGVRMKNGQPLSLQFVNVAGSANGNATFVVVQGMWRKLGVEVQVKNYTSSLFFASYGANGVIQRGRFDLTFFSWINGVDPDDSSNFMCSQMPPVGQNVFHLCDRELDAAEAVALTSNDRAVRKKAYDKIQERLALQVPMIVTWFQRRLVVYNSDFKNFKPAHAVTEFWNSWEWEI